MSDGRDRFSPLPPRGIALTRDGYGNNTGKDGTAASVGGTGTLISDLHNLCKAYDHLNRARCLEIMTGYGVGPKLLRLQARFWDQAVMVCCARG